MSSEREQEHEREERLERMRRLPERLTRLVEGKSDQELCRAGAGGQWGAVEHLAHLRDFDEVTLDRVQQIIDGTEPELEIFDTDVRAIELDYHAQSPLRMLSEFRDLRDRLVDFLESLPEDAWSRTARHPTLGRVSLEDLIRRVDEHDSVHFTTLRDDIL
jgi:hypothetical protein